MNLYLRALLGKPSLTPPYCVVPHCNAPAAIPGRRKDPRNPLIRLCGSGTTGHHGQTHARRLHLRWRTEDCDTCPLFPAACEHCVTPGWWECLTTEVPTKYENALDTPGWVKCRGPHLTTITRGR